MDFERIILSVQRAQGKKGEKGKEFSLKMEKTLALISKLSKIRRNFNERRL